MAKEAVRIAGSDQPILLELEDRPNSLEVARADQAGRPTKCLLEELGFRESLILPDNLALMTTPQDIWGNPWAIFRPRSPEGKNQDHLDPKLFTIFVRYSEGDFVEFMKQLRNPRGGYYIFFP